MFFFIAPNTRNLQEELTIFDFPQQDWTNLCKNFDETIKSRFRDNFNYASFREGEKMRIDLALLFTWRAIAKM